MKDPLLVRNDEPPAPLPSVEFPRRTPDPIAPSAASPVAGTSPAPAAPSQGRSLAPSSQVFGPAFTQALLIVCILMLGITIGMKLSDYFHSRSLEQQELALLRSAQSRLESMPPAAPAATPVVAVVPAPAPSPAPAQTASAPVAPAPTSPDYSDQLAALQQERDMMRQRFETISAPTGGTPAPGASGEAPPAAESFLPASPQPSQTASFLPPRATLTPAQQRIKDAPSLGKVMEYDTDWHFVVVSCGANHNVSQSQQLAIRRGHEILGLVRLDEVLPDQSVANLEGTWKVDAEAPKPQVGDDVLTYPPF